MVLNAPALPEPFEPASLRANRAGGAGELRHGAFDEAMDKAERDFTGPERAEATRSEAYKVQLQEYRARTRLEAEAGERGMKTFEELGKEKYDEQIDRESKEQRADYEREETNATDHGTILMNPMHHEKCTSYDVAVGYTRLTEADWPHLRQLADWRYVPKKYGDTYYATGKVQEKIAVHHAYPKDQLAELGIPARRNNPSMAAMSFSSAEEALRRGPNPAAQTDVA
mgnify:CR=1 FL=1